MTSRTVSITVRFSIPDSDELHTPVTMPDEQPTTYLEDLLADLAEILGHDGREFIREELGDAVEFIVANFEIGKPHTESDDW